MDYYVQMCVDVTISVGDDSDAISRIVASGDEWREQFYKDVKTEQDVLEHLAYNAIMNGVGDASRLDGWADLPVGEVTMRALDVYR